MEAASIIPPKGDRRRDNGFADGGTGGSKVLVMGGRAFDRFFFRCLISPRFPFRLPRKSSRVCSHIVRSAENRPTTDKNYRCQTLRILRPTPASRR